MDLKKWFIHTVLKRDPAGATPTGEPSWSTPVSVPCRVQYKRKQVIDTQGQQVLSDCQVYSNQEISISSQVQLPGETEYRFVRAVLRAQNKDGSFAFWEIAL